MSSLPTQRPESLILRRRHLASSGIYLAVIPIAFLGSLIGVPQLSDPNVLFSAIIANAVGFLTPFLALVGLGRLVSSRDQDEPITIWLIVATGALLAGTKSMITMAFEPLFVDGTWGSLSWSRLSVASFLGALYFPAATVVLARWERVKANHALLVVERLSRQSEGELNDRYESVLSDIVNSARTVLKTHSSHPKRAARRMRALLERRVRPLSRKLALPESEDLTNFRLHDMVKFMFRRRSFSPLVSALGLAVTSTYFVVSTVGWIEGTGRISLTMMLAFAILWIATRTPTSSTTSSAVIVFTSVIAFAALNEWFSKIIFGAFPGVMWWWTAVLNTTILGINLVITGVWRVARADHREIRRQLDQALPAGHWRKETRELTLRHRQRELADLLHGKVQNQLLQLIIALEKESGQLSEEAVRKTLDEIEGSWKHPPRQKRDLPVSEGLRDLAARWAGIVDVSFTIAGDEYPAELRSNLVRIAEEAVSNAVRHGLASEVAINVSGKGNLCTIVVDDNGVGPRGKRPGIGTSHLAQNSEKWSLTRSPTLGGARLTAVLDTSN